MKTIVAKDFLDRRRQDPDIQVIDVRYDIEVRGTRLSGNVHYLPLDRVHIDRVKAMMADVTKPIYLICRTDNRSRKAAQLLEEQGLKTLHVVLGGMVECESLGAPMIKAEIISLERQVRIVAGLLVLLGVGLGAFIHPVYYVLSAFVGGGLVFAGLTDWCGMALLLNKAPWNRKKS